MSERELARRQARWDAGRGRRRTYESAGPRPDRVAAWAVFLGIFLVLVASASSRGDTGGAGLPPSGGSGTVQPGAGSADPAAGQDPVARIANMSVRVATWYGPGFYGLRTACGLRLKRTTPGVAHRTLPCGTPVTLYYGGRFESVRVIDRGPHARGVTWDLTAATARRLGFRRTGKIRSLP